MALPTDGMAGARRNASSRLDSLGMGLGGNAPSGEGKQPMGDVNYRAAVDPASSCGQCQHFQSPNACELVAGNIDPMATCDLFAPAGGTLLSAPAGAGSPPPPGPPVRP